MVKLAAWWRGHRKAVIAVIGLLLDVAALAAPDSKWVAAAVSAATALGVYAVRNEHQAPAPLSTRPGQRLAGGK